MASIRQNDIGFNATFQPSPEGLKKYLDEVPDLIVQSGNLNLARLGSVTLSDSPIKSVSAQVSFDRPFTIGQSSLDVKASGSATLKVIAPDKPNQPLFDPNDFGDAITIGKDERYVSFGVDATASATATAELGRFGFGASINGAIAIANYRRYQQGSAPPLIDAIKETVGGFTIPVETSDLEAMSEGEIVTVETSGSLGFSVKANVLAWTNPLATVSIPLTTSSVDVGANASVDVGASFSVSGKYQMRVRKMSANRVRLSFHRSQGMSLTVTVNAVAGLTASLDKGDDLLMQLLKAITKDPASPSVTEGLTDVEIDALNDVVENSISRTLEVSLSASVNATDRKDAIFTFDAFLPAVGGEEAAVETALHGDLRALTGDSVPTGITVITNRFGEVKSRTVRLTVNLFGIYSFGSVSRLIHERSSFVGPDGSLNIADKITATRVKYGADRTAFRNLLVESFVISSGWAAGHTDPNPCTHTWLELHDRTKADTMRGELEVAQGLNELSWTDVEALVGLHGEFGTTEMRALIRYSDSALRDAFIDGNGQPRSAGHYDSLGRAAMRQFIREGTVDGFRLDPLVDDALWAAMRRVGQPSFNQMFGDIHGPVIASDYTKIVWWSDAMASAAKLVVQLHSLLDRNPNDPHVPAVRDQLAAKLVNVARESGDHFNEAWGLLAMYYAAGSPGGYFLQYSGPYVNEVFEKDARALAIRVAA